jgi:hypothetical protein
MSGNPKIVEAGLRTQFSADNQPANKGRPKGSRDALSRAFIEALHADFVEHGAQVIATVRVTDPSTYMRVTANLLPKELEITQNATDRLSDEDLELLYREALKVLKDKQADAAIASTEWLSRPMTKVN